MYSGSIVAITWDSKTSQGNPHGHTSWCSKPNSSGGCQRLRVATHLASPLIDSFMKINARKKYAALGCLFVTTWCLQAQPVNEGKAAAPEFSPALAETAFDQLWQAF